MNIINVFKCKKCGQKIKLEDVKTVDLHMYAEETWPRDLYMYIILRQLREKSPSIRRIKWKYHSILYNANGPSAPGAANFCAAWKDCGPLISTIDIEEIVKSQMD